MSRIKRFTSQVNTAYSKDKNMFHYFFLFVVIDKLSNAVSRFSRNVRNRSFPSLLPRCPRGISNFPSQTAKLSAFANKTVRSNREYLLARRKSELKLLKLPLREKFKILCEIRRLTSNRLYD